jgi:hypothetical protein
MSRKSMKNVIDNLSSLIMKHPLCMHGRLVIRRDEKKKRKERREKQRKNEKKTRMDDNMI